MFLLHLERRDGTPLILHYDPQASTLTAPNGRRLSLLGLAEPPPPFAEASRVSPTMPGRKSTRPRMAKIALGLGCNMACAYCSQHDERAGASAAPSGEVGAFLAGLPHWATEVRVWRLFGGEPFVYWRRLKPLVEGLRAFSPEAEIALITNGMLLDREKVEWIEANDLSIAVSHDGPGQFLRGEDPLDHPVAGAAIADLYRRRPHRLGFNCVLTRDNHSLLDIHRHISARLGGPITLWSEGIAKSYGTFADPVIIATADEWTAIRRRIFADAARPELLTEGAVRAALSEVFTALRDGRPDQALGQRCGLDREDSIAVTLAGQVLTCNNLAAEGRHVIGHIRDLNAARLNTAWHWSHFETCRSCPVVQLCAGGCMYLEGKARDDTCEGQFHYWLPLLALAVYMIADARPLRLEADRIRLAGLTSLDF